MKNTVTEQFLSTLAHSLKGKQSSQEIDFLKAYYQRLSRQDFVEERALEFRNLALRHKHLGHVRQPGQTLIDICNQRPDGVGSNQDISTTVINIVIDEKPFVINSLTMKLNSLRKNPLRLLHPIFKVSRDAQHALVAIERYQHEDALSNNQWFIECYIQFIIDYVPEHEHQQVVSALEQVISDINVVVHDWKDMRQSALELAEVSASDRDAAMLDEYRALFRWMAEDHFAFLGYCELSVTQSQEDQTVNLVPESTRGVLRITKHHDDDAALKLLPPIGFSPTSPVVFTKTRQQSTIHRANYMDCILFDHGTESTPDKSRQTTVSCMLGFLSGSSARLPTGEIPHLREKTVYVLEQSEFRRGGYAYKELTTILETLPREKLFQLDRDSLYALCMSLLNQQERRKTRLYLHRDICGHFYSCLVYVPRDIFNSKLRQQIQTYLAKRLEAEEVSFQVHFSDSILTRIHYTVHRSLSSGREITQSELEQAVQNIARDWNDRLYEAIRATSGDEIAKQTLDIFRDGFSSNYQDDFETETAVVDINICNQLQPGEIRAVLGHSGQEKPPGTSLIQASFKIYSINYSIPLSDVLPVLENMGVRVLGERPYRINTVNGQSFRVHDFEIVRKDGKPFDLATNGEKFESTFIQCSEGHVDNDGYNQLTLIANLTWRQIALLRAYYKYLKQIRLRYSENYIIDALVSNPELVVAIIHYFNERYHPTSTGHTVDQRLETVRSLFEQVHTLDEDRILRALLDVVLATLRTNYFQQHENGQTKSYISFKLSSGSIPRIPEPSPKFEIFVYSPRVEGVHLRGGEVARGGLRWSERPEDFRTEVLGLVKAQRVKNAVIVPVGSKGGFVAKQLPDGSRQAIQKEVIACYKIFISSLLDLTDNLRNNRIIPPKDVVRLDKDDPYLVVAADKGTATFSDIANGLSEQYGFWLGDAFASGGSVGYDHKKMGITARGAWESVKRHFRERGKDIQNTDFTVVGIGDMGGDVFGNGMLLSKHIRLIAAFNHLHIFIDPNPDAAESYRERKRLFDTPGSSWADYSETLISKGGAVYSRDAKSIQLSEQARLALGAEENQYAPNDLINVILKSEVELLWNGGIGTYVKASSETHADAQDRNNDVLRVDANQLRCKVIGEGGNLGMTQLGRIEFTQRGGLCYTDAIDNSAGVDTSDHEVNLKILLNAAMQRGDLKMRQRNAMLARMEDEIGILVLNNNYIQTQILSIEASFSQKLMPQQSRSIALLEQKGLLNRAIEYLPDDATLKERMDSGNYLTRPEIAVLLSYSKMNLYQNLLHTTLPDEAYLSTEIMRYFPKLMERKYPELIQQHRLKREIISTQLTNELVGIMGPSFHLRLADLTGASVESICHAYVTARDILSIEAINTQVRELDNQVSAQLQMECLTQCAAAMESAITWLIRNNESPFDIEQTVSQFAKPYQKLCRDVEKSTTSVAEGFLDTVNHYTERGLPPALSKRIASLMTLSHAMDIIDIARVHGKSAGVVRDVYFQVSDQLGLNWLQHAIVALPVTSTWHERAQFSLSDDLRVTHTAITSRVLSQAGTARKALERWISKNRKTVNNLNEMFSHLKEEVSVDFAMLSVLVSELNRLR